MASQNAVIIPLANSLYASGLVTNETRQDVQHTTGLFPSLRATKLLDATVKVAQGSMEKAPKFCECLQKRGIPVPEKILQGKTVESLFFTSSITQVMLKIIFIEFVLKTVQIRYEK